MLKAETVDRALQEIAKGYAQYQYFFDKLSSPVWLEPLSQRGLFKHPPPPEPIGEYVRLPFWPESRYLTRIAGVAEAQDTVLKITMGIPRSENSRVYDDIADIALALPPHLAANLVAQVSDGVQLPIKLVLAEKIGDLIVHLAAGQEGIAAATLTRAALALAPDPRADNADNKADNPLRFPEPQAHFREWYYARIVSKAVPALAKTVGLETVRLFSDLLDGAIQLSRKSSEDQNSDEDYLYISFPAIEEGPERDDALSVLLAATRDAAEQVITINRDAFTPVLDIFASKRWVSFRRMRLHICRIFPDQALPLAEQTFQNPEILDRASLQHEAVLLLKSVFPAFSSESQQALLEWIDRGRSEESIRRWLEFVQQPVTEENVQQLSNIWRRDRYAMLEGQLPEPYQRRLEDLVTAAGEARALEKPRRITGGAVGAQSPKSPEEVEAMSGNEIIEFLGTWIPGSGMFEATAEGMGQQLAAAATKRPNEFAEIAAKFRSLDPTYVRALFGGLTNALKQKLSFDWKPVLDLAVWVTGQPRVMPSRKGGLMIADPDWGWTRDSIIDLLNAGFETEHPGRLPYDSRVPVWTVLRPLTDDPNPSLEDEGGKKFDPASLSINSTRGRAMHAAVSYARWVRLCTDASRKAEELPPITFAEMPEVHEVLEAHLDVAREPTRTIRAVYGDHLTLLAFLDWDWVRANIARILPTVGDNEAFFRAAWDSFVVFNWPNITLLPELISSYQRAVAGPGKGAEERRYPRSPEDSLAEHLMVYYWLGKLEFGGADRLLDDFFARASGEVRGHAIWFIGTSVAGWKDDPPREVFLRLRDLFRRRFEAAQGAASTEPYDKELSNFGHWFTSEKFEERWSLDTLLAALQLAKKAEPEMDVVKRLAETCPTYPVECVSCLRLMIEGDREGWLLLGVEADARLLLKRALDSNNPDGTLAARRFVEELIAKGQFGFRDLLA